MEIKYRNTWDTLSKLKMSIRDLSNIYSQLSSSWKKKIIFVSLLIRDYMLISFFRV